MKKNNCKKILFILLLAALLFYLLLNLPMYREGLILTGKFNYNIFRHFLIVFRFPVRFTTIILSFLSFFKLSIKIIFLLSFFAIYIGYSCIFLKKKAFKIISIILTVLLIFLTVIYSLLGNLQILMEQSLLNIILGSKNIFSNIGIPKNVIRNGHFIITIELAILSISIKYLILLFGFVNSLILAFNSDIKKKFKIIASVIFALFAVMCAICLPINDILAVSNSKFYIYANYNYLTGQYSDYEAIYLAMHILKYAKLILFSMLILFAVIFVISLFIVIIIRAFKENNKLIKVFSITIHSLNIIYIYFILLCHVVSTLFCLNIF